MYMQICRYADTSYICTTIIWPCLSFTDAVVSCGADGLPQWTWTGCRGSIIVVVISIVTSIMTITC